MRNKKGFTLVELAIVITIIGLLIGGVMKGQELLEDARITQAGMQLKSVTSAAVLFRTKYRDLPGDMPRPGARLPACTGTCATAGNGNNWIGYSPSTSDTQYGSSGEQNTFWLHLQAGGFLTAPAPASDGVIYMPSDIGFNSFIQVQGWPYGSNMDSVHWFYLWRAPSTSPTSSVPLYVWGKYDKKYDDGHPWRGDVFINSGSACGSSQTTTASNSYGPNDKTPCLDQIKAGF